MSETKQTKRNTRPKKNEKLNDKNAYKNNEVNADTIKIFSLFRNIKERKVVPQGLSVIYMKQRNYEFVIIRYLVYYRLTNSKVMQSA
jgi:hypothetical protein